MKFRFPYETLMKERRIRRDEAEREFRLAQAKVKESKQALIQLRTRLAEVRLETQSVREKGGKMAPALIAMETFVEGQKIRIQNQVRVVRGLEEVAEEKRLVLVEVARDLKVLEKLKEKRYTEFKKMLKKRETKFIDEIASNREARERMR